MPRRHPIELTRRDFLRRAGGTALAVPSLAAILAAGSKPGETASGASSSPTRPIADPNNRVTLTLKGAPIAADTPIETGATLKVYKIPHPDRTSAHGGDGLLHGRTPLILSGDAPSGRVRRVRLRVHAFPALREGRRGELP